MVRIRHGGRRPCASAKRRSRRWAADSTRSGGAGSMPRPVIGHSVVKMKKTIINCPRRHRKVTPVKIGTKRPRNVAARSRAAHSVERAWSPQRLHAPQQKRCADQICCEDRVNYLCRLHPCIVLAASSTMHEMPVPTSIGATIWSTASMPLAQQVNRRSRMRLMVARTSGHSS